MVATGGLPFARGCGPGCEPILGRPGGGVSCLVTRFRGDFLQEWKGRRWNFANPGPRLEHGIIDSPVFIHVFCSGMGGGMPTAPAQGSSLAGLTSWPTAWHESRLLNRRVWCFWCCLPPRWFWIPTRRFFYEGCVPWYHDAAHVFRVGMPEAGMQRSQWLTRRSGLGGKESGVGPTRPRSAQWFVLAS